MTNHAPQKSTCQRLAELVELDTEFAWVNLPEAPEDVRTNSDVYRRNDEIDSVIPAPLLSEMLEVVPPLQIEVWKDDTEKFVAGWIKRGEIINFEAENPAEAAAQLLIFLVKEGHVNPEDL